MVMLIKYKKLMLFNLQVTLHVISSPISSDIMCHFNIKQYKNNIDLFIYSCILFNFALDSTFEENPYSFSKIKNT